MCCALVGLNNQLHLITSCFELHCGFYIHFEMRIVILKKRDYFKDIAIKGRIKMHLERIVVECVDCILLAVSG